MTFWHGLQIVLHFHLLRRWEDAPLMEPGCMCNSPMLSRLSDPHGMGMADHTTTVNEGPGLDNRVGETGQRWGHKVDKAQGVRCR